MAPRTLKIVCAISILLNIFLLAAVVGGATWLRTRHPMIMAGAIRIAGAELPQEQRRAFRQALRAARREMRPTAIAGRSAREEAAALLRAPTVDPAALASALARVRAADLAVREHVEARAIAFATHLAPGERAKLAEGIVRRPSPPTRR